MEAFSSDDECVDATWELPVVTNDLPERESDIEEEVNVLLETPPDVSQTVNRRDIWKRRPFEIQLESNCGYKHTYRDSLSLFFPCISMMNL